MKTFIERWALSKSLKRDLMNIADLYKIDLNNQKWPYVKCHGDFYFKNILLDKKRCYLIDWELSDYHVFFYDPIYFMLVDSIRMKDFRLLDDFFRGRFDKYFCNIFKLAGIYFSQFKRIEYVNICIVEHITKIGNLFTAIHDNPYIELLKEIHERYNVE